jgi:hypothetical protein
MLRDLRGLRDRKFCFDRQVLAGLFYASESRAASRRVKDPLIRTHVGVSGVGYIVEKLELMLTDLGPVMGTMMWRAVRGSRAIGLGLLVLLWGATGWAHRFLRFGPSLVLLLLFPLNP